MIVLETVSDVEKYLRSRGAWMRTKYSEGVWYAVISDEYCRIVGGLQDKLAVAIADCLVRYETAKARLLFR